MNIQFKQGKNEWAKSSFIANVENNKFLNQGLKTQ